MIRRLFLAAGVVLALLARASHAQAPPEAADPYARELAEAIVTMDDDRARLSYVAALETMIADQIERGLDLSDPAKKAMVCGIVHERFEALKAQLIRARVAALAQTFTVPEMEGYLAFGRSPTGRALRRASPALIKAVADATVSTPSGNEAGLPEPRRARIDRILAAQGVEDSARRGWRTLNRVFLQSIAAASKTTPPAVIPNNQAAEDAFAQRLVLAEARFYADNFSDAQLDELVTYFEGPVGRVMTERAPELAARSASVAPKLFQQQFERMDKDTCKALACTPAQRATLDERFETLQTLMAASANAMAH